MTNSEIKEQVIEALYERSTYIKKVNNTEYRTRCKFCGDSQKNRNTGHLYIKINPEDNYPMVYHCFKCEASGIVDGEFLNIMEIDDVNLKSSVKSLNKTSDKLKNNNFINGDYDNIMFDYKRPEIKRCVKTEYIERRLGKTLSDDDLTSLKTITSLRDFLILNNIHDLQLPNYYLHKLENNYVGFLSYGNSHILFRDITGKENLKWIKYPITEQSKQSRLFYSVESVVDIFSNDTININLAEGVFDIASCVFNINNSTENSINIAVCGKHYLSILNKLLMLGFVGSNINLNIYADNDLEFNKNSKNPTTLGYFQKLLYKYKYLYGRINILYNVIGKDIGVPINEISLAKYKLT